MIIISISGLDPYVTAHYSKDHTANLANLFEIDEKELCFEATSSFLLYKGVEQVSWNALVRVYAPHKFEPFEEVVNRYLQKTLKDFAIHIIVEFHYLHDHSQYVSINSDYPRYIDDSHIERDVDDEEEEDRGYDEDVYDGNIFEGYEEKLDAVYEKIEKDAKD